MSYQPQRLRNLPILCRSVILSFNILPCAALNESLVDVLVKLFITFGTVILAVVFVLELAVNVPTATQFF